MGYIGVLQGKKNNITEEQQIPSSQQPVHLMMASGDN
jgi:hypothetical protein